MHELPFFMKTPWFFLLASVMIILGYLGMRDTVKKGDKAIETKIFSYGLYYMFKPAYGDEAIKLGRAYKRIGYIVFGFVLFFLLLVSYFLKDVIF